MSHLSNYYHLQALLNEGRDKPYRQDSVIRNAYTGMGYSDRDVSLHNELSGELIHLNRNQILAWVIYSGIVHRFITFIPALAIAKGWEIVIEEEQGKNKKKVGGYTDKLKSILEYSLDKENLDVKIPACFFQAQIEANVGDGIRGGACLLLNIVDGREPWEEVDYQSIKTIRSVYLLGVREISPAYETSSLYRLGNQNFTHYRLNVSLNTNGTENEDIVKMNANKIHKSRVLHFGGNILPQTMKRHFYLFDGWDASTLCQIYHSFGRLDTCLEAIAEIVRTSSIGNHKIKGLNEKLTAGARGMVGDAPSAEIDKLQKLLLAKRKLTSVWGHRATDMTDEALEYLARPFNGLEGVVQVIRDSLVSDTGLPHTVVLGESPGGWASTGESQEKDIAKAVLSFQTTKWLSPLKKLYRLIMLAKDSAFAGSPPPRWDIKFHSVLDLSDEQILNLQSMQSQIDSTYQGLGVISTQEIRQNRYKTEFSLTTDLDDAAWKKEQEQAMAAEESPTPPKEDTTGDPKLDQILAKFQSANNDIAALTPEEIAYIQARQDILS